MSKGGKKKPKKKELEPTGVAEIDSLTIFPLHH